jgi:hypothetical protein
VTCAEAESRADAAEMLRSAEESTEAVELARLLVKGAPWRDIQPVLAALKPEVSPESVRHVVRAYVTKVVLGANSEGAAGRGIEILDAFAEPFNQHDGLSPLVLAVGRLRLGRAYD